MPRVYTVEFANVSVSAVQDLIAAYSGANRTIRVLAIQLAANGQTTIGNYPIRLYRLAATVTAGSGGATPTPQPLDPNDAAAAFTAHTNDTTPATSSGSTSVIFSDQLNPINGYYWQAPHPVEAAPSQALVLELDAISGTLNVSGTMWVEEA